MNGGDRVLLPVASELELNTEVHNSLARMERMLFQASWTGNVEVLLKLVEENPSILIIPALEGGETPLHIASMAGQLEFVKEVMKLRRQFAQELNQDGLSPLHIASGTGNNEIVKELLRWDCGLCLLKGRARRIPLHYAAIKGKVNVVKELLLVNSDSVEEVTARGETALHLAVKNNQFDVLEALVEHLKQFNRGDVLNKKDDQGNTFLHLAASKKQYEVVDLVLNKTIVSEGAIEINSLNKRCLTALDVLLLCPSEAGDREIEDIFRQAGAQKADDLLSPSQGSQAGLDQTQEVVIVDSPDEQSRPDQPGSPARQLKEYFKYNKNRDSPGEVRSTLLVICALIATATYQAVLSPPGGVWQDDLVPGSNNCTNSSQWHVAGQSVMCSKNGVSFGLFLLFNSVGFFTSLNMIYCLTSGFPFQLELQISMCALIVTYDTSMSAITPSGKLATFFSVISSTLPFLIPISTDAVRKYLKRSWKKLWNRNQENV